MCLRFILTADYVFFRIAMLLPSNFGFSQLNQHFALTIFFKNSIPTFFSVVHKVERWRCLLTQKRGKSSCAISNRLSYLDYREPFKKNFMCTLEFTFSVIQFMCIFHFDKMIYVICSTRGASQIFEKRCFYNKIEIFCANLNGFSFFCRSCIQKTLFTNFYIIKLWKVV